MAPTRTAAEERIWAAIRAAGTDEGPFGPEPGKSPRGIWSRAVEVPLEDLGALYSTAPTRDIGRGLSPEDRLTSVREKRHWKPLEIAIARSGGMKIIDGNHRIFVAREREDPIVVAQFFLVDKPYWDPAPPRRKNPLSPADTSMLAQAYREGPDVSKTPAGRALGRAQAARIHQDFAELRQKLRVEFTDEDPYVCTAKDGRTAFEQMAHDIEVNGRLRVFTGGTSSPLWDRETNAMARAVHDYDHYRARADFSMDGELRAYKAAAARTPELAPVHLSEIVLQAADYQLHGGVYAPAQKLVIPPREIEQLVRRANPVISYALLDTRIARYRATLESVRDKYDMFLPAIRDVENYIATLPPNERLDVYNPPPSLAPEVAVYKEQGARMATGPAVIFTIATAETLQGSPGNAIDIRDTALSVLQGYELPPKLRKAVEKVSRYFAKSRPPKRARGQKLTDFYTKEMAALTDAYKALSEAVRTGVRHEEAAKGSLAREVAAGPFKLLNTGGFDALTMDTVRAVVESAARRMIAHGITSPLYGEISVTNTLASAKILAFYDPPTDHAFVRANLRKVEREAEQTVIHELVHRLDHITPALTKLLPQLYRDVQAAERKEREAMFEAAWKAHAPKPGDVYMAADASRTYEVARVEYQGRGIKGILSGQSGYVVRLEDRKTAPGAVLKAHIAAEGYLQNKGLLSPRTKSGFITNYAMKNPAENFAELVSFWCMGKISPEQEALLLPVLRAGGLDVRSHTPA